MKKIKRRRNKKKKISRQLNGVITVELTYLIPLILLIFVSVVYATFYYHDKNILIGAAAETAVVGAQMERKPDTDGAVDLNAFFQERIQGKLVFFPGAEAAIDISDKWVSVEANAYNRGMQVDVWQRASVMDPEKRIRRKRIAEEIVHQE